MSYPDLAGAKEVIFICYTFIPPPPHHHIVDEKWAWESLCYDGRCDLPTGEEELVTYGHFRRLPPHLYNGDILIFQSREILNQMREIQSQMREIPIPTGEKEVTYGNFRRLPPTSTSLYRSDSLTSSLSDDRVLSKNTLAGLAFQDFQTSG